jgi:hypothetical protein
METKSRKFIGGIYHGEEPDTDCEQSANPAYPEFFFWHWNDGRVHPNHPALFSR